MRLLIAEDEVDLAEALTAFFEKINHAFLKSLVI